ncbi:hypothetical protein [Serratia marcescens]|uniref:hypothetical protein n=1 Tax=Serratia marcescens TaxID=615 RepID=UPI003989125E
MEFMKIKCTGAFYDEYYGAVFYTFDTVPQIGHGYWAISEGGDSAYNTLNDQVTQVDYPEELLMLLEHIPENIEIEGLENGDSD